MALLFLNKVDASGNSTNTLTDTAAATYGVNSFENLKKKIVDFGAAHNRRLCYVIELDKNPTESSYNPIDNPIIDKDGMCADLDSDNITHIEFLEPVQDMLLSDLSKFPAIFELSPKKKDVDLDIYYQASGLQPIMLNHETNEEYIPIGSTFTTVDSSANRTTHTVTSWSHQTINFTPTLPANTTIADMATISFFKRSNYWVGSKVNGQVTSGTAITLHGGPTSTGSQRLFKQYHMLDWSNCFSYGNGVETDRVRDSFNEPRIANGVKASTVLAEPVREERRKHGLIFSGIYNSTSGVNNTNQFIAAEKITKDLNPTYGSIQKLFSRQTDLITFCEDRVVKVLANKDAVFNADGNAQLTANENVLGQSVPFVGEYGISKNPESFASESFRAYFTDKQRGAVLRLSKDGLTPISKTGMHDWFRDNLSFHTSLIGTYDNYKENYNITLSNTYTENIMFNTLFNLGADSQAIDASVLSVLQNGSLTQGVSYSHSYNSKNIGTHPDLVFNTSSGGGGPDETFIESTITVKNQNIFRVFDNHWSYCCVVHGMIILSCVSFCFLSSGPLSEEQMPSSLS